jgi:hypothetical protein
MADNPQVNVTEASEVAAQAQTRGYLQGAFVTPDVLTSLTDDQAFQVTADQSAAKDVGTLNLQDRNQSLAAFAGVRDRLYATTSRRNLLLLGYYRRLLRQRALAKLDYDLSIHDQQYEGGA